MVQKGFVWDLHECKNSSKVTADGFLGGPLLKNRPLMAVALNVKCP